jgi:hypothetical protein
MLRKKLVLLLMLVTLLVALAVPGSTSASCSGDNCGCGYYAAECRYECQFEPLEYQRACLHECLVENKNCSIACCDPTVY